MTDISNNDAANNKDDKAIASALEVINRNWVEKNQQDIRNRMIQDLFEKGFEVRSPDGTKKINSKLLYQAIWRTANRMKPLDFAIHGSGADANTERIVRDGVSTVLDRGRYVSSLRDKQGGFFNLLMFGDSPMMVGANPKEGPPIVFNTLSNDGLYVDQFATSMRWNGWGRNATKATAIFSYSWSEFIGMYPEMEKKAGLGRIPRELDSTGQRELFRNPTGVNYELEDLIEVAYSYDISDEPNFTVFAGGKCTKISEVKGKKYPFKLDGEEYIPILNFMCMPSSEGFYNHGVGAMIYDLAIVMQRLLNMEIGHVEDNTYPIELVGVAQGEAAKFFNKLKLAHEMRAQGKKGYVVLEREGGDANGHAVTSQTLLTQNLFNEWQILFDRLANELKRMGIFIDELNVDPNVKATKILIDEENANSFVKQIMEYNASESKFAVDLTMDCIKKFVREDDKTPLNLTTSIETSFGTSRADGVTLGMVAKELKARHYFTKINARTGAIPSNALRAAQVARGLQFAVPGSKAYTKLLSEFSQIHDLDVSGDEYVPAMPGGGANEGAAEGGSTPIATGTDRLTALPRRQEQIPVL